MRINKTTGLIAFTLLAITTIGFWSFLKRGDSKRTTKEFQRLQNIIAETIDKDAWETSSTTHSNIRIVTACGSEGCETYLVDENGNRIPQTNNSNETTSEDDPFN